MEAFDRWAEGRGMWLHGLEERGRHKEAEELEEELKP